MTNNELAFRRTREQLHETIKRVESVNVSTARSVIALPDGSVLSRSAGTFSFDLSDALEVSPGVTAYVGAVTELDQFVKDAALNRLNDEMTALTVAIAN
ncbi:hypothetical protein [uncultured Roseobacter sp.]|uniref:hypothetical protein n=1 Tax=uncultured Roseobacter sp. TaxID=114847 RepID=UPI00261FE240|nr:hypothetical protein [uncultured Roseobacter sp.]